jgi:hypothetical protein
MLRISIIMGWLMIRKWQPGSRHQELLIVLLLGDNNQNGQEDNEFHFDFCIIKKKRLNVRTLLD